MNIWYALAAIPVILLLVWELYRKMPSKSAGKAPSRPKTDVEWVAEARCPDCHQETLLQGPSGGMAMNVGCEGCHMEFNVGFGFGTGPFMVDRTGKMNEGRAYVFGISAEQYQATEMRRAS